MGDESLYNIDIKLATFKRLEYYNGYTDADKSFYGEGVQQLLNGVETIEDLITKHKSIHSNLKTKKKKMHSNILLSVAIYILSKQN